MARRRNMNGEGTITQRADGRWEARVSLPDGKRKSFYGKTEKEVAQKLKQAQRDIDAGTPIGDARQTVEQYLLTWLDDARHRLKPNSFRRYESYIRVHVIPSIGRLSISRLTPQHLQTLYSRKIDEGLSAESVRHMHSMLRTSFADAVRLSLLSRNIVEMVRQPRKIHREMRVLDERQVMLFIEEAQKDTNGALYILAVTSGMRLGELSALKWRDIDLDRGTLQVQQSLASTTKGLVFSEPKTKNSRRTIRLTKVALYALRKQRIEHLEKALQGGSDWNSYDLVFPNSVGMPLDPHNLTYRKFRQFLKDAELPRIRFHDLRHTAATLMLKRGVHVKVVSEMLGHSSIGMTLSIYGHVLPDMQQMAVDAIDTLFE